MTLSRVALDSPATDKPVALGFPVELEFRRVSFGHEFFLMLVLLALQENFQKIIELERDLLGIENLVQAGRVGIAINFYWRPSLFNALG